MPHGAGSGVPDSTFQLRLSIARTANRACVGTHRSAVDRGPAGRSASPVAKAEWRSGVALRSDRNAYEEDPSVNRRQQLDGLSSRTSSTDAKSGGVFLQLHTKQTRQLRVWADVRPYPLGLQEYAMTDIPAATTGEPLTNRTINFKATVDGLNYELLLAQKTIHVGRPTSARLRITTAEGKGFTQLEPLMVTFAHLVGFNQD